MRSRTTSVPQQPTPLLLNAYPKPLSPSRERLWVQYGGHHTAQTPPRPAESPKSIPVATFLARYKKKRRTVGHTAVGGTAACRRALLHHFNYWQPHWRHSMWRFVDRAGCFCCWSSCRPKHQTEFAKSIAESAARTTDDAVRDWGDPHPTSQIAWRCRSPHHHRHDTQQHPVGNRL